MSATTPKANDMQVAGDHYRTGYQHWDFVADICLCYFDAQVIKYVSRWRKKNGVQDLQKARHVLLKTAEIAVHGAAAVLLSGVSLNQDFVKGCTEAYITHNALTPAEADVVRAVVAWTTPADLIAVTAKVEWMITEAEDLAANPGPGYVNQDR